MGGAISAAGECLNDGRWQCSSLPREDRLGDDGHSTHGSSGVGEERGVANQLTVIIPCKDEAHNIRACIDSVREVADEIIVADSGSTDRTLDIVRELGGCKIIEREYINSANFKNWAIPQAEHPWVLIVDADERVTDQLARQIQEILAEDTPAADGYRVRRQPYFLGRRICFSGWASSSVVRLFRRDVARYAELHVHSDVSVSTGRVGWLRERLLHYTCQDLTDFMGKQNRYAQWSAQDMYRAGRRVSYPGLLLRPAARFLQFFLLRGGIFDGIGGVMVCSVVACYTFMKYGKLWELQTSDTGGARQAAAPMHADVRKVA